MKTRKSPTAMPVVTITTRLLVTSATNAGAAFPSVTARRDGLMSIKTLNQAIDEFHITHADAQLAGKQGFMAGAEWMRSQFKLHGTDDCRRCEDGRSTMYVTLNGLCVECAHALQTNPEVSGE